MLNLLNFLNSLKLNLKLHKIKISSFVYFSYKYKYKYKYIKIIIIKKILKKKLKKLQKNLVLKKNYYNKYIKIIVKKNKLKFTRYIKKRFNITLEDIMDAFFMGSSFLIIFKLVTRIIFYYIIYFSISWKLNLLIYIFGFILQLKFNLLFSLRESVIKIWKVLLGKNFWFFPTLWEEIWDEIEEGKIKNTNFINKCFQHLFYFFVFIRLWVLANKYLFLIFNFVITFWLISNHYLLLSSSISILLLLSRITMFLSEFNNNELLKSLNYIEFINYDDKIKLTLKNVKIITFWIIRTFNDRNRHFQVIESNKIRKKHKRIAYISFENVFYFKYRQLPCKFKIPFLRLNDDVTFYSRLAQAEDENESYYLNKYQLLDIKRKFTPEITYSTFIKCTTFASFLNPGSIFFRSTKTQTHCLSSISPIPYENIKALGHPEIFFFDPLTGYFSRINKSSLRQPENPELFKLGDSPYTGYSTLQVGTTIKLKPMDIHAIECEIIQKVQNGEIKVIDITNDKEIPFSDFNLMLQEIINTQGNISKKIVTSNMKDLLDLRSKPSDIIIPDTLSVIYAFNNPFASKIQSLSALQEGIKYHENIISSAKRENISQSQVDYHIKRVTLLRGVKIDIQGQLSSNFSSVDNLYINSLLEDIEKINNSIETTRSTSPFVNITNTLAVIHNEPATERVAKRHVSNINKIPKRIGGIYKDFSDVD